MRTANCWTGPRNADRIDVLASYLSQASYVILSGFRAALDIETYPLSNLIRQQCAERAKRGRGKPVLITHIGFFACFDSIDNDSLQKIEFRIGRFVPRC